jgi:uncharacterized protein (DUF433 family)
MANPPDEQLQRVAINSSVVGGQPHIRGTRIVVAQILDGLSEGLTPGQLLDHYPQLSLDDIRAACAWAAMQGGKEQGERTKIQVL